MEIGSKIKRLRVHITSPSIATLMDILEALGTNVSEFFSDREDDGVMTYAADDMFIKADEEAGVTIRWLVTNAQRNALEPILVTLAPGASTEPDDPHEGEEFGYVLSGVITLVSGEQKRKVRRGDAFYFRPTGVHYLINTGKSEGKVLWVSTPPSF